MGVVIAQPLISSFGRTAEELNASILVGQFLAVTRPALFEDYEAIGFERAFEKLGNREVSFEHCTEEGHNTEDEIIMTIPGDPIMRLQATIQSFEDRDGQLFVVFKEETVDEAGNALDGFLLTEEARIVFLDDDEAF